MSLMEYMKFESGSFADLDYLSTEEIKKLTLEDGIARLLLEDNLRNRIANEQNYKILKMRTKLGQLSGWSMLIKEHNSRLGLARINDGVYMCFLDERLRGQGYAEWIWEETLAAFGEDRKYSVIVHDDASRNFYWKLLQVYPKNIEINHWVF